MLANVLLTRYSNFLIGFAVDLLAILFMSYVLYFRRHWRSDLLLSYIALNIGIYMVMSLLGTVRLDVAVGFGLFAILSIIRLRSSQVTQQEVGYYFVGLVLGLINGLGSGDRILSVTMTVLLLVTMMIFDSKVLRERSERLDVKLDHLYLEDRTLKAELERRLGGRVMYHEVTEVNFINQHMTIDVRIRPGTGVPAPVEEKHHKAHPDGSPQAPSPSPHPVGQQGMNPNVDYGRHNSPPQ